MNVEAEKNELILKNSNGDRAVIPANKRKKVLELIDKGNDKAIDRIVEKLPVLEEYAQDGSTIPSYSGNFSEAFSNARKDLGPKKTFVWNDKKYTTNYKTEVEDTEIGGNDFASAFSKARKEKGANSTFTWNDKKYTTNLKDEKPTKTESKDEKPVTKKKPLKGSKKDPIELDDVNVTSKKATDKKEPTQFNEFNQPIKGYPDNPKDDFAVNLNQGNPIKLPEVNITGEKEEFSNKDNPVELPEVNITAKRKDPYDVSNITSSYKDKFSPQDLTVEKSDNSKRVKVSSPSKIKDKDKKFYKQLEDYSNQIRVREFNDTSNVEENSEANQIKTTDTTATANKIERELLNKDSTNTISREKAFSQVNDAFVDSVYKADDYNHNYYFVVDKPTQSIYKVDIGDKNPTLLGKVGIGEKVGDKPVSKGRDSKKGTLQTQAGWVRINRETPFKKRNEDYGDEFNGFESYVNDSWKEINTGIHGTENKSEGRVSHGCTRLNCELEKELQPLLNEGVMLFYTSDKGK